VAGQLGQDSAGVDQRYARRHLAGVADVQEAEWMPGLLVEGELAAPSPLALFGHPAQITEDPVHRHPVDPQPRTAVDPGPPAARCGDGDVSTLPAGGKLTQRDKVELLVVVDAQVDIRIGPMGPTGTTAAQRNRPNTADAGKVTGHVLQSPVADHSPSLGTSRLS